MYDLNMNKQLGTKWFTFYTKVRPWLACLSALTIVVDFIQYTEIYAKTWWLMLYFFAGITQAVLSIMVFVKSKGFYIDFVRFVKGVLLFETIYVVYGQGVKQYLQNGYDLLTTLVISVILFLIAFFVWYKLNVKYFEKRIEKEPLIQENTTPEEGLNNVIKIQTEETNKNLQENINDKKSKIRFCKLCGSQIDVQTKKCIGCGKQYFRGIKLGKNLIIAVLTVMLVVSVVFNVIQHDENNTLHQQIYELEIEERILNTKLIDLSEALLQDKYTGNSILESLRYAAKKENAERLAREILGKNK